MRIETKRRIEPNVHLVIIALWFALFTTLFGGGRDTSILHAIAAAFVSTIICTIVFALFEHFTKERK